MELFKWYQWSDALATVAGSKRPVLLIQRKKSGNFGAYSYDKDWYEIFVSKEGYLQRGQMPSRYKLHKLIKFIWRKTQL